MCIMNTVRSMYFCEETYLKSKISDDSHTSFREENSTFIGFPLFSSAAYLSVFGRKSADFSALDEYRRSRTIYVKLAEIEDGISAESRRHYDLICGH